MAVGIFDSGLGGLTVLDAVEKRLPDMPFVYLADSAHAPYGVRTSEDIFELTCASVQRLFDAGCDLVILACNTASAAALRRMQESWIPENKRVLGVFVPLIEAMTERQWGDNSPPREVAVKHVALFATPATVASRAFQRELAFRAIGVDAKNEISFEELLKGAQGMARAFQGVVSTDDLMALDVSERADSGLASVLS